MSTTDSIEHKMLVEDAYQALGYIQNWISQGLPTSEISVRGTNCPRSSE